jgi:hypothetical protein
MPLPVWLPTWLSNLLGTGWLRGLLGIRKDLVDTKKAKLEVKKLQHEERTRNSLITPATFDDVKKYDPKLAAIIREIAKGEEGGLSLGGSKYFEAALLYLYRYKRKKYWLYVGLIILAVTLWGWFVLWLSGMLS